MKPGQIVTVDWRDALHGSGEPNKIRPAIVVGSALYFGTKLPFEIVVPLSGEVMLAITGASLAILPNSDNGCTKICYALAWNVQSVPLTRVSETTSHVSASELASIRAQVAACMLG